MTSADKEQVLSGGNVAADVVRVGDTVRKPAGPYSPAVHALLRHLEDVGFDGAPRSFGFDADGRHVLEFVPGPMADTQPAMTTDELRRVGALIRELHDACSTFVPPVHARWNVVIPPDRHELICHHDLAPWNLVLADGRWVFIDWDGAGPGSRGWDLGYAAHGFVPLAPGGEVTVDAPRLRALVDGYRLDRAGRLALPALIGAHTRGMYELLVDGARTGTQPWARLHAEGHAQHWGPAADYIDAHRDEWLAALD